MAHVNLHVASGLAVGAAVTVLPLARAWLAGKPVFTPIVRMVVASFALAFWAVVPSAMTVLGASPSVHKAWWANLFLGHGLIARRIDGGMLLGEVAIAAYVTTLYLLILLAIRRARRSMPTP